MTIEDTPDYITGNHFFANIGQNLAENLTGDWDFDGESATVYMDTIITNDDRTWLGRVVCLMLP